MTDSEIANGRSGSSLMKVRPKPSCRTCFPQLLCTVVEFQCAANMHSPLWEDLQTTNTLQVTQRYNYIEFLFAVTTVGADKITNENG